MAIKLPTDGKVRGGEESSAPASSDRPSARLDYIDGLRGIAILMVLMRHFYMATYTSGQPRWVDAFSLGYLGVHLFLLLSGFCVAWAFVGPRAKDQTLREFASRRATRILPAYFAAFFLCLPFAAIPAGSLVRQIVTHLTLTHNLFPDTTLAVNGVFWSLGLECQLYVAFPLLLTGFRRFGSALTLIAVLLFQISYRSFVAGYVGTHGVAAETFCWAVFGRVFEFALGIQAAIWVGRWMQSAPRMDFRPWLFPLALLCFVSGVVAKSRLGMTAPQTDLAWSLGFFCLLIASSKPSGLLHGLLSRRLLTALGVFSYSVYLTHNLVLTPCVHLLQPHFVSTRLFFWGLVPTLAACLAFSYGFYRLVEKPCTDYFAARRRKSLLRSVAHEYAVVHQR